jgi:phage-related holin
MKEIWNWVQLAFAAIGGFLGWFLGGLDGFLYALIAFVAIDYVTGVLCAIIDKKLSSEIGAKGIFKKVLIFVLVSTRDTEVTPAVYSLVTATRPLPDNAHGTALV